MITDQKCREIPKANFSLKIIFVVLFVLNGLATVRCSVKTHPRFHSPDTSPSELDITYQLKDDSHWNWLSWRGTFADEIQSNCSNESSAESFPDDLFTEEQLGSGAIVLHFLGGVYSFTLLAVVCNDYFIPAVECICVDLHLTPDVAAATFMAVATSSPELFINIMSTFVTKSDLGIGTIVGSAMFNTLGVGAIGGLAASRPIPIKKWPLIRDCLIYILNVSILVSMTWDSIVEWWECTILIVLYVLYFFFMFNNKKIIGFISSIFKKKAGMGGFNFDKAESNDQKEERLDDFEDRYTARVSVILSKRRSTIRSFKFDKDRVITEIMEEEEEDKKVRKSLWRYPTGASIGKQMWFVYTWPLKLLLTCCVPSPKTFRRLYPVTFIMCIVCIGVNSYFVSWMITTIGALFNIPDSIMGMTFLAFGGCLPEACSIFIMSRRGHGGMGVSNSLGANSLAILFSLGIPWFIKSMILRAQGDEGYIRIASNGMDYIIISLIFAVICLYIVLYLGKFYLKRSVGATILVIYFIFIILAILMESGIFFEISC